MGKDSITLLKSKDFAIRIVRLYNYLYNEKNERVMSKQMVRSGTSIGANLSEAIFGMSNRDFLSKLRISLKECSETKYWLELLFQTGYLTENQYKSIDDDCTELIKLLIASSKTMTGNMRKTKSSKA